MDMHSFKLGDKLKDDRLKSLFDDATRFYKEKRILGAQRALQFGGEQLLRHQMRLYNCFDRKTRFLTSTGIKSFEDFNVGDVTCVLTHNGNWKLAKVNSYGQQEIFEVALSLGSSTKKVNVTRNHRWILHDGTHTTNLQVGDRLFKEPNIFGEFNWETASIDEKLYWCYGFVYGDGTVSNGYSLVRLCGSDIVFESRFLEMGFKTSSSLSLKGDIIVYTGKYKKTLPDPNVDSPELIRAFVSGYLNADGICNSRKLGKKYQGIQATGNESIEFIRSIFPIAGVHVISEQDLTGQITNFGVRPKTSRFVTSDTPGSIYNSGWKVISIESTGRWEDVWCLEVEDDQSFILDGGIVTGNCVSGHLNRPEAFGEYFYILLCGAGCGMSVQKHHVASLPMIRPRTKQPKTFVIPDSIEGWASAVDVLLSSFFIGGGKHPEYEGRRVYFDSTEIREKGSHISGGFKAPGPEPLVNALNRIERLLVSIAEEGILRPIHCYDICMFIADAVLSGGVRRAATIFIFSPDDDEMMQAKTGNWFETNPQRARSNNSMLLVRDKVDKESFFAAIDTIRQYGEPGFIFADSTEFTFNPCVEIGMLPITADGRYGFQGCNLVEINGAAIETAEDFYESCKLASALATIQASYTDFKFVTDATREIFEREALLGVSITGFMNRPDILMDEDVLRRGAEIVREINREVAQIIGINKAARTTCVKPSGNASVLLGTASGIHDEHARKYLRTMQISKMSEIGEIFKRENPYMIEDSVWSQSKSDYSIAFPVIVDAKSHVKDNTSALEFLNRVKSIQQSWVEAGTDIEWSTDARLRHNVSNTVRVKDNEWNEIMEFLFENRAHFAGISFLADMGDKDFYQAPFIEVLEPEEIVAKYGDAAIFASGLIVDSTNGFDNLWTAINTAIYNGTTNQELKDVRADWIRRFHKFAENYFDGDLTKTSYCLKEVYIRHKWFKIQTNYREIDFHRSMIAQRAIDIDTTGAVACSAGACEISFA